MEDDHAWVTLVTDVDSGVSAIILESRAQGVVTGGYNRRMSMDFVSQDSAVQPGRYRHHLRRSAAAIPPGLVIGRVTGVGGERQDIFRSVTVEPLASLSKLETVLVMTSFVPKKVSRRELLLRHPAAAHRSPLSKCPSRRCSASPACSPTLCSSCSSAWLIAARPERGLWLIPVGGFLLGLVDGAPLGTAIIAMAPLALLQDMRGSQLREGGLALTIIFVRDHDRRLPPHLPDDVHPAAASPPAGCRR